MLPTPIQMLLLAIVGWLNEHQRLQIAFLEEQVRVLANCTATGGSASTTTNGAVSPRKATAWEEKAA